MYTILGAGLSGLSLADELKKRNIDFQIFEAKGYAGGHIHSEERDGFTWDEGPHVSFTKYKEVKEYFEDNCEHNFLEYPPKPTNYFKGNWIPHPAQANLYAVPEPLNSECVQDLLQIRKDLPVDFSPKNYQEWLTYAFGETFSKTFPEVYTQKYWTTKPENLTTDWVGKRVYFPEVDDMVNSLNGPLQKDTHYITKVRYPIKGGFFSYIKNVAQKLEINFNKEVNYVSFKNKQITFSDGEKIYYENLVSTIPLPILILKSDAPQEVKNCANKLKCSQVLIVNVVANHQTKTHNHWIYVYDKEFYSTRINFTELLSPNNGQDGKTGIQVEVYFSSYNPIKDPINKIEQDVIKELISMGLIDKEDNVESFHSKWIEWANVIFDKDRIAAQDCVYEWLETQGMKRETDDLFPMTDWDNKEPQELGNIILAGRFAQWKYYWTDDCVMRSKYITKCTT